MSIGKRLREARKRDNLTAKQLSELSGVPEKSIYRIETEEVEDPRLSSILPLIGNLSCTADEMLFGPGEYKSLGRLKQIFQELENIGPEYLETLIKVANAIHLEATIESQMASGKKEIKV